MSQGKILASGAFGSKALRLGEDETPRPVGVSHAASDSSKRAWLVTLGGTDRRRVTIQVAAESVDVVDGSLVFRDDGLVCHVQAPGTWRSCAVKGALILGRSRVQVVGSISSRQLEDVL